MQRMLQLLVVLVVSVATSAGCYLECSGTFSARIQQLVGLSDQVTLTQKSCQAMSEQIACLEAKRPQCDATTLRYVNTIVNYIRPDYQKTCESVNGTNVTVIQTPIQHPLMACAQRVQQCYGNFSSFFATINISNASQQDVAIVCAKMTKGLDDYSTCLERVKPDCGQFLGMSQALLTIKMLQQRYSFVCIGTQNMEVVMQCVNDTMDCYGDFNDTFVSALRYYDISEMCSAIDNYTLCLDRVHKRAECQRFTQQAMLTVSGVRRQYSVYCSADGGLATEKCVQDFQQCYSAFNQNYFPAKRLSNVDGICSSLKSYGDCVQPLHLNCKQHIAQALVAVRILKEQFAVQCDPEFQKLQACKSLSLCSDNFPNSFNQGTTVFSSVVCRNLASYFPCVKTSLEQCGIPPEDPSVDFAQLGPLAEAYCSNLLGNRVLNTCPEFVACVSGTVLVRSHDPSSMYDADTWCSYLDTSLSCVDRAVNTKHCGLSSDDTIIGHLTQQRALKRKICKMASVPSIRLDGGDTMQGVSEGQHGTSRGVMNLPSAVASLTVLLTVAYQLIR